MDFRRCFENNLKRTRAIGFLFFISNIKIIETKIMKVLLAKSETLGVVCIRISVSNEENNTHDMHIMHKIDQLLFNSIILNFKFC